MIIRILPTWQIATEQSFTKIKVFLVIRYYYAAGNVPSSFFLFKVSLVFLQGVPLAPVSPLFLLSITQCNKSLKNKPNR